MAIALTHTTVAVGTDNGNGEIGKTQWNEAHTLSMATGKLLGRTTAGTGAAEEITVGTGLTFAAGELSASGGTGDVVGPASSTDNALARFDSTTGLLLQNSSGATLSDNWALSLAGATVTTSEPLLNLTQTWNAGAVTFTGLKANVTDTASAAASLLMDLQIGGASKAYFTKAGGLGLNATAICDYNSTLASYLWFSPSNVRFNEAGGLEVGTSSLRKFLISNFSTSKIVNIASDWFIGWSAFTTVSGAADSSIFRIGAGILGIRGAASTNGAALSFIEQTAPAAPAANGCYIYAQDNGAGKTQLMALFASGAAQQIAIEP